MVRPVWLTSAPVRLLPIRLTVDRGRRREVVAVVPATPRMTVTCRCSVGSPLIWTCSVVAGRRVDELEHVVVHQERRVGERQRRSSCWRRDRGAERGRPCPVLVGVHQEVDPLDRHVRQSGHERVAVREPVADRDGDVVPCLDAGLLGAEETLQEVADMGKISVRRIAVLGSLRGPAGVPSRGDFGCLKEVIPLK